MDWDHETREATRLAPTLAAYLDEEVVRPMRSKRKYTRAKEKEKGKGLAFGAMPAAASKLKAIPSVALRGQSSDAACFLDGDRLALGGQNSTSLVDLATQEESSILFGSSCTAFDAPSGRLLLADWGKVALVDAATAKVLSRWTAKLGHWAGALFAAGGALAITYSTKPSIALWDVGGGEGLPPQDDSEHAPSVDLAEGQPVAVLAGHESWVHSARLSPDGSLLASGDDDGKLCLFRVRDRSLVWSASLPAPIYGVDFAPDGQSIFAGLEPGEIHVLDARGETERTFSAAGKIIDLRVLDGGRLAVLLWDALSLVEPEKGETLCQVRTGKGAHVSRIADVRGDVILLSRPAKLFRVS